MSTIGFSLANSIGQLAQTPTTVTLQPQRAIAGIVADAVLEEKHSDSLVITEHPVEVGSVIADHAYKLPVEVVLTYVWSAGSDQNGGDATFLQSLYQQFRQLQANAVLFNIITGKSSYENMILQHIYETTDRKTENILSLTLVCREVILTRTQIIQLSSAAQQALPNKTAPTVNQGNVNLGPAPNFNATPGGR